MSFLSDFFRAFALTSLPHRITIFTNIATTVVILSPSVPTLLHAVLTVPNSALTNSMACKVFRDVKFGNHAQNMNPVLWQTGNNYNNGRVSNAPPCIPTMVKVEKETFISYGYHSDTASQPDSSSVNSEMAVSSIVSPSVSRGCEV